jgi:hypothetical protein
VKGFVLVLVLVAAAAVLAAPAFGATYTDHGTAVWGDGHYCTGCTAYIHNLTTGANGSTKTNSNGDWTASGFVPGYGYQVFIAYFLGSCSYSTNTFTWTQESNNQVIPNFGTALTMGPPNPPGCPNYPQG